jgi:hypothetical protein
MYEYMHNSITSSNQNKGFVVEVIDRMYNENFTSKDKISTMLSIQCELISPRFTYRLDKLKPRASTFRGPSAKVYNVFNTVIGLSHLCCHNVLYFLNNPSGIFLTQLHFISEYCRILTPVIIFAFIEID